VGNDKPNTPADQCPTTNNIQYLTLPYLTGKVCYLLALRPPVCPMCVLELTFSLLEVTSSNWSIRN